MKYTRKLTSLLLLASLAAAQTNPANPAEVRDLHILRNDNELKLEITLSRPVQPIVTLARDPDRLVLDLPNTASTAKQERRSVDQGGVKSIRMGLNSTNPLLTRMVVDMEQARPYGVNASGNKITLTVVLAEQDAKRGPRKGAPVPAASGPLLGRLHRNPQPSVTYGEITVSAAPVSPPAALPPLKLPQTQESASSNSSKPATSRPSAAHPNYGSLQQGTVFPNAGAPGTGTVPQLSTSTVAAGQLNPADLSQAKAGDQVSTGGAFSSANTAITPAEKPTTSTPPALTNTASQTTRAVAKTAPDSSPGAVASASGNPAPTTSAPAAALNPTVAVSAGPRLHVSQGSGSTAVASRAIDQPPVPPATTPQPIPTTNASSTFAANITVTPNTAAVAPSPSAKIAEAAAGSSGMSTQSATAAANKEATASVGVDQKVAINGDSSTPILAARQPNSDLRMSFRVKYVAEGAAYLEGGRSSGLSEGMKLEVRDITVPPDQDKSAAQNAPVIAELDVISVAETSAVTEIHVPKRDVKPGDFAFLSSEDTETLVAQRSLSATRKYPTIISFTDGDPLDEEAREDVPRPPLPEINRARGRIGFDYSSVVSHGAFSSWSSSTGIILRTDITRIGGTYWNLNGYWRGRLTSSSGGQQTIQDLINRTYTLGLTYDNPRSAWVAGFGRLYLPYATSLDTIDGGYFGRRVSSSATIGIFAGSTPDPTSWSYNPNQEIGGTFVNFQGGSFDGTRYTSTSGVGVNMLKWAINRPFVFFENGIYYKRLFSLYSAVQADRPAGNAAVTSPGPGLSRSFTTLRLQPLDRLELDFNHTYFRDLPTFDPTLIGTGLLDKYLFQGFSFGPRVEVIKDIWVYSSFGRSSRTGDARSSWNEMYGVTFGYLPWTRVRADVHYSKFDSSFGSGKYTAMSLSRDFKDTFRWEVLAGIQSYSSSVATSNKSHFVTGNFEAPLGSHFFLQSGYTWNRGGTQDYDQYLFSIGYRFDSKYKGAGQ
jgi:AMIN domain